MAMRQGEEGFYLAEKPLDDHGTDGRYERFASYHRHDVGSRKAIVVFTIVCFVAFYRVEAPISPTVPCRS